MLPNLNDILSKKDYSKKLEPLKVYKSSRSSRYCISPVPSKLLGGSFIKPLQHRRNITTLVNSPYKRSKSNIPALTCSSTSCKGYNPSKPSKENQDTVIVHPLLDKDTSLFGICDGHGLYGKEISNFIGQYLPTYIQNQEITANLFIDCISVIETEMKKCKFDVAYSGSTLVLCCIHKNRLFSLNIGDSRAILAKRGYIKWDFVQLTRDHKPDLPEECSRIVNSGGRVAASTTGGPARVWMLEKNYPGLAMSRSLGDTAVHQIGVSSEPEISERLLGEEDEFLVIGSDGLFEFLSNQEVANIAGDHYGNPKHACEELSSAARARWIRVIHIQKQESIDDISCVVVYLR